MSRRDQGDRGAVAVITAVVVSMVLLAVAAVAVDLGVQRVARRDMQALADVVALDLARLLDGRSAGEVRAGAGGAPTLAAALDASVARNDDHTLGGVADCGGSCVSAYLVDLDDGGDYATSADGTPVEVATGAAPEAVVVRARTEVDFAFGLGVSGSAQRSAVATGGEPAVCFSVGTKTLTLDTSGSALGPLLDHILKVNLSAVGYSGIVDLRNVHVPLADLLVELQVGSPGELASTNVGLADFIVAAADVLRAHGDPASAAILEAIRLGVTGLAVNLGEILALDTGTDLAGLTADINLLDILGVAVVAANGDHALEVAIPGLAEVSIIEPPRIACGKEGARAHSAQVRLHVDAALPTGPGLLGGHVDLAIEVGSGTATLTRLACTPEAVGLDVTTAGVAVLPPSRGRFGQVGLEITLAKFLEPLGFLGAPLVLAIKLLGLDKVGLDARVTGSVASASGHREVSFPPAPALPDPVVVGSESVLDLTGAQVRLATGQAGLASLLAGILNPVLSALLDGVVRPLVNSVVDPVVSAVLNPLLELLGIRLGVAEVSLLGRPGCTAVRLVG
ncbi:hypothetical protein [Nocardioides sp. TF02-7]|uniref:hypothetical protein n=1 Tax=Nocardioides sp. TF02-7 TaxID=2917724 RepID=UPI001F060F90|nr:hypothetical protein [Nocardioides sp. TF02-7]UMG93024.1 hypothetical protein MF408_01340 [Nocardioides sp. TF02-7]